MGANIIIFIFFLFYSNTFGLCLEHRRYPHTIKVLNEICNFIKDNKIIRYLFVDMLCKIINI